MSKPITRSNPAMGGGLGHADHAAGRAGQDRVLAPEGAAVGQAAVGLHEQQPGVATPARRATLST